MREKILIAKNISMHFGGVKAIDDISLDVEDGQILGIIGPNGSGKSTFFNVLTGLYKPTTGTFTYKGENITGYAPHRLCRRGLARTFQNIRVFKRLTVLKNVLIGQHSELKTTFVPALLRTAGSKAEEKEFEERALDLLEFVDLSDRIYEYSGNLAYGEQRRLEIARALASDPKILLLDEPTAGMNPTEAEKVINLFHRIHERGITIVLIEHNMRVMMQTAEYIFAFASGKLIAQGLPKEIQYNPKVIEAYLGEED